MSAETIASQWASFRRIALDTNPTLTPYQIEDFRRAFYCGAASAAYIAGTVFEAMDQMGNDPPPEPEKTRWVAVMAELRLFRDVMQVTDD